MDGETVKQVLVLSNQEVCKEKKRKEKRKQNQTKNHRCCNMNLRGKGLFFFLRGGKTVSWTCPSVRSLCTGAWKMVLKFSC